MADVTTRPPSGAGRSGRGNGGNGNGGRISRQVDEAAFYHEAGLNGTWTGARLALGGLTFLFGSFVFAYFYLRSIDSAGRWQGSGYHPPSILQGTFIMFLIVISAGVQYAALQRIKAGHKRTWQIGGTLALVLGLGAVAWQIIMLLYLPFWPGSSGFSSVYVGFHPVFIVVLLAGLAWLEILLMQSRSIPEIHFVEQPPTYQETFAVQRFQASLSGFTTVWNYLAGIAILFWVLFYVIV